MENVERKLASIRRVSEILPIEGADSIEIAKVDGWQCVVKKGDFKAGDIGVYFEIDSVLPEREEFEFMRARHFRVRTIKLRKQLSQGLMMPLSILGNTGEEVFIGADVTQRLGVVKYEPAIPATLAGQIKGSFPAFIEKTDQERCQNLVAEIAEAVEKGTLFEITEKLDGTSMTVYLNEGEFGVCSRNLDQKRAENPDENSTFWKVAIGMGLEDAMKKVGRNIALQGELIGPGIQKNRYKLDKQQFMIFDVYDIDAKRHLTPSERFEVLAQVFDADPAAMTHVPVIHDRVPVNLTVAEMLTQADGVSKLADTPREGLVFKSHDLRKTHESQTGMIFHFKAISNEFLLKEE